VPITTDVVSSNLDQEGGGVQHYFKLSCYPVSLSTICCYAQFLSRSLKSVDSIRNGVRVLHLYLDYPFPHSENFVYKLLIKGLVKTKQHFPRRALPITPDI
jgi:hypothetical protein